MVRMTVEPLSLFSVSRRVDPDLFAAEQHRLFAGRNLRIGRSKTVHALAWRDWINGLTLPFPACHQGWSGVGAAGELHPTGLAPSCLKCMRIRGLPVDGEAEQPALFVLPRQERDEPAPD